MAVMVSASGSADSPQVDTEIIVGNLSRPWSLAFLPGHQDIPGRERLLITERPGRLVYYSGGRKQTVPGLPRTAAEGQGGLLDVVLSPDFGRDSLVYFSFSESIPGGLGTSVGRGRFRSDGNPELTDTEVIYTARPGSAGGRHFGSRLVFDNDGYLYVTLGDRGSRERARDTFDPYGSVVRLNPDGSVPRDNPFAPGGTNPGQGTPEMWSTGHRNAQGMALHPETGEIWIHEHGPKGGDEVNIIRAGADYGWPLLTHGVEYSGAEITDITSAPGFEDPLLHWTPSIAPSGMAFVTGDIYPDWKGNLFVGALAGRHLRRVVLQEGMPVSQELLLSGTLGRIRDVRVSPGGYLYVLTDENDGGVYRLMP